MFTKYPSPATALNADVLTACQEVPPELSVKDKFPEPSVTKIWSAVPSAAGKVKLSMITCPDPFGRIDISILVSLSTRNGYDRIQLDSPP